MIDCNLFWEGRARQYAARGLGLRAVCSYAMPGFYNLAIDVTQRHALRSVLASVSESSTVLDFGCGIGRWSRVLARRGARVTGVDFSATMLEQAALRTAAAGLGPRCNFVLGDITRSTPTGEYDLILGVTVLQHVLEDQRLSETIAILAKQLRPGGRLVLLEAAPARRGRHAETASFRARPLSNYLAAIEAAGLQLERVRGVDPAPFKLWVVPRFRGWPRWLALAALGVATACALPIDLLFASVLSSRSWHKIIISRDPRGMS